MFARLHHSRGSTVYKMDESSWLLPDLQGNNSGTKMNGYIKGLQTPGKPGALATYARVAVSTLPPKPTAAGFRPGAAHTLAMSISAEIAVHTTGHDLTNLSALWGPRSCRRAAGWRGLGPT